MAKRMKSKNEPASAGGARRGSDDDAKGALPDSAQLKAHVAELNELKASGAEINGKIGALTKNGEEQHNIHRGALKLAAKLDRMDPSKRSEFLIHFDHYCDILGLAVEPTLFEGAGTSAAALN